MILCSRDPGTMDPLAGPIMWFTCILLPMITPNRQLAHRNYLMPPTGPFS
jgi:hypothetical protein